MVDKSPTPEPSLDDAYFAALYRIFAPAPVVLRFVQEPGARPLLSSSFAQPWCIISAFNPESNKRSDAENQARNSALRERILEIKDHEPIRTLSSDVQGRFPESGFLIQRIRRAAAQRLAEEFEQRAVVFCDGSPAQAGLLFPDDGRWITRPAFLYPGLP